MIELAVHKLLTGDLSCCDWRGEKEEEYSNHRSIILHCTVFPHLTPKIATVS